MDCLPTAIARHVSLASSHFPSFASSALRRVIGLEGPGMTLWDFGRVRYGAEELLFCETREGVRNGKFSHWRMRCEVVQLARVVSEFSGVGCEWWQKWAAGCLKKLRWLEQSTSLYLVSTSPPPHHPQPQRDKGQLLAGTTSFGHFCVTILGRCSQCPWSRSLN